ncbi:hypothetical protein [Fervidibacter sacchari]
MPAEVGEWVPFGGYFPKTEGAAKSPLPVSSPQSLDMLKNLSISADKGFGQVAFA